MQGEQYIATIIKEVVGQEISRIDTTAPGYISFLEKHTRGMPPREARDYEVFFRDKMQFVNEFKFCFLGILMDYCSGRIRFPVEDIVRGVIAELIKVHYSAKARMILEDRRCHDFVSKYVEEFETIVRNSRGFDFSTLKSPGNETPVDKFAYVNAHQLVNVIAIQLEALEKKDEFVPLQPKRVSGNGRGSGGDASGGHTGSPGGKYVPDYLVQLQSAAKRKRSTGTGLGIVVVLFGVMLLGLYLTTGSVHPMAVYRSSNTTAKVLLTTLAGSLAIQLFRVVLAYVRRLSQSYNGNYDIFGMRESVEMGTGKSTKGMLCPSCNLPVLRDNDKLGLPIVCHRCSVAWHDGPRCYRRGMPPSNAMLPSYDCPNCRPPGP